MKQADIGLVGLGVMGKNLALNVNDHRFTVAVYNRTSSKVDEFLAEEARDASILGAHSLEEFISLLKKPRRIMLMIKSGQPVRQMIDKLLPRLDSGDIIIDGGNSNFLDSIRDGELVEAKRMMYVGCGVSGGEEGARHGPSLMPGGSPAAWPHIEKIFRAIAAKAPDGTPCCDWIGENGSGHFVKMVHNGIEYGDMQLICESYDLMHSLLGMEPLEESDVFAAWNKGKLNSYLIEITADILARRDKDGKPLVDQILDAAAQKGTGRWVAEEALRSDIPLTLITEAVFARYLSAMKEDRVVAASELTGPEPAFTGGRKDFLHDIGEALYLAKIISYAQGFMLLRAASARHGWNLNYRSIALMWRGGCIIRAAFLDKIGDAFARQPGLTNLLLDSYFKEQVTSTQQSLRHVVAQAASTGVPLPAMSSALAFFDGYRRDRLPANLLQAQRDYFGAHTYERVDKPRGEFFHTDWSKKE